MTAPKVRVVNRDDCAGMQPQKAPQSDGFEGVALSNLPDALKPITSENFHVLRFADAWLPLAEDNLTPVRSLFHAHPIAFTVVLGDSPAHDARRRADLAHTDEITSKSVAIGSPHQRIHNHLDSPKTHSRMKPESVASLLARELELTIHNWIDLVEEAAVLTYTSRSSDRWPGLLPKLLAGPHPAAEVSPGRDEIRTYRSWPSWRGLPEIRMHLCHGEKRVAEVAGGSPQNTSKASAHGRPGQRVPFHNGDRR